MATKRCKECGAEHTNTSQESNYTELSDTCARCTSLLSMLDVFVAASNQYIPLGAARPTRKLTITGYKIEKI